MMNKDLSLCNIKGLKYGSHLCIIIGLVGGFFFFTDFVDSIVFCRGLVVSFCHCPPRGLRRPSLEFRETS